MPAAPLPFRLLSPAEYALLSATEKVEYLARLTADIQKHVRTFREENKRLVQWLLQKDGMTRR
jgi:hypothetical protein